MAEAVSRSRSVAVSSIGIFFLEYPLEIMAKHHESLRATLDAAAANMKGLRQFLLPRTLSAAAKWQATMASRVY